MNNIKSISEKSRNHQANRFFGGEVGLSRAAALVF
jgi:hypothetical protein